MGGRIGVCGNGGVDGICALDEIGIVGRMGGE